MSDTTPGGQTGGNVSTPTVGSNTAGIEPVRGSGAASGVAGQGAAGALNQPAAAPIRLTEDSEFIPPGSDKPVKYGDYYRNFQSQFTRKAQEAAAAQQQIQALNQRLQEFERRSQQGQQQQQPHRLQALAQQLKSLTYLNGEQAAGVVENVLQEIVGQQQELKRRDMALAIVVNRMKQMGEVLDQLHGAHRTTDFDSKMTKFVKAAGLNPANEKVMEWAKSYYVAHEGEDLDQEFPRMLKEAWNNLQAVYNEERTNKVNAARNAPFIPGKGGNGVASKPLNDKLTRQSSARDIADALWPSMVDGAIET